MKLKTFLILLFSFLVASPVLAADFTPPPFKDQSFQGRFYSQSVADPIVLKTGEVKEVTIKIKNTGKSTWSNTGSNFVTVYTIEPNYRSSVFYGTGWIGKDQPAKIIKATKPGEIGEFKIKLYGPSKIGEYTERFYLAAENKSWIEGTYFFLKIKVEKATAATVSKLSSTSVAATAYQAGLVIKTASELSATGGDKIKFSARFLNTGSTAWNNYSLKEGSITAKDLSITSYTPVSLADDTWVDKKTILSSATKVESHTPIQLDFYFRAPAKQGQYNLRFELTADNQTISGGYFELPITVTADAPVGYQEQTFAAATTRSLISEPNIRIGLYKAEGVVKFSSPFPYNIYVNQALWGTLPANEEATLSYANGVYTFDSPTWQFAAADTLRLVPDDPTYYFALTNYERRAAWKGNPNFNKYRGSMELKYSPKSDAAFVVNELPLDEYVAGIAETSDGAATEYIKALLVAARSYAFYHIYNGVPLENRTFDVYATTADQLYFGYNSEILMPHVAEAARATHGEMVTYQGQPVVTPYFGHTDGWTRTWTEVWGGTNKPWLQSVECVYDAGQTLWGHGVGMSAQDASQRASKDGWSYQQLLKYYYTNTEVERVY